MSDLKPCPVCGKPPKLMKGVQTTVGVNYECVNKKCEMRPRVMTVEFGPTLPREMQYNQSTEAPADIIERARIRWNRRAIPPGYVLVPEEPTEEMVDAAERINWKDSDVRGNFINQWQAMIAAAAKEK